MQKRKECERQYADGVAIGSGEGGTGGAGSGPAAATAAADPEQQRRLLREVQRRSDLVSYALLAEINHFHRDQVLGQMASHARRLLRTHIDFYRKVSTKKKKCTLYTGICCIYLIEKTSKNIVLVVKI